MAAQALGVSTSTLRRWEASGRLTPARTEGGQRRYDLSALRPDARSGAQAVRKTVACARVSSHDQKATWSGKNGYSNCTAPVMDGRAI
ncbi:recombinase family protein [Massilia aurea]|uniref:recombinase family protein n=1 Tax=Massilia aurea TaxID=373040 RepID=UPI00351CD9A9